MDAKGNARVGQFKGMQRCVYLSLSFFCLLSLEADQVGSIMFGDKLDKDQWERLIRRLSETRQGFMCAHGRPSLVPLAVLDRRGTVAGREIDWTAWGEEHLGRVRGS